jgi:flavodoxin
MKALVVYHSETGNTKKVADAIYGAISGEKELKGIESVKDLSGYDLVFVGFPVQSGKPSKKATDLLESNSNKGKLALFCTQGALKDSDFALGALLQAKQLCGAASVVGTFNCQGEVAAKILEAVAQKPEFQSWLKDARVSVGHPDRSDLEQAGQFAKDIVSKAMA